MARNPFENRTEKMSDEILVSSAVRGDKYSLEKLIKKHQGWIYNLAIRMIYNPADAEDATQEILVRIITNLGGFRSDSSFRTWAYRIACNHVLSLKRSRLARERQRSFGEYWEIIRNTPDSEPFGSVNYSAETDALIDEVRTECMLGIIACLDRDQRIVFILGAVFGIKDSVACEILSIRRENFRQKLSRARGQVRNFMEGRCGLLESSNPCRCGRKIKSLIQKGIVDPENLKFRPEYCAKARTMSIAGSRILSRVFEDKITRLFRNHFMFKSPDFTESLREIIRNGELSPILMFPGK